MAENDELLLSTLTRQANHSAVLESKLNGLVNASSENLSLGLARLEILRSQLGQAENQSQDMATLVAEPGRTAARMAAKLSQLDIQHNRIKQAGEYVDSVQQLCTCILGLHNSMDNQDWEAAARYIHEANSLGHDLITSEFAEAMVPTIQVPESPAVALDNASQSLASLFLREFDKAAKVKDMARLSRFFKLLPLIGKNAQGLESYGRFVCGIISSQSRTLMQNRPPEGPNVYGLMFSRLFESIANIIEQHTPLVTRYYGSTSMMPVIERIQIEADIQGGIIIDTFMDERQIKRRISEVKSYPFEYLVQTFTSSSSSSSAPQSARNSMDSANMDDSVDVKEIDQLLNECSLMISRWSLYCLFVARKFKIKGENQDLHLPDMMVTSALNQKVKQLLNPCFETMSTFFLRRSVEKASQLEEYPDLDSVDINAPVTSMVDDVMYILDASLARVVSTGHAQLICNVISNFRRVLESDYVGIVQQKLRNEPMTRQQLSSSTITTTAPTDRQITTFALLLNNLSVSLTYIKRITDKIRKTLGDRLLLGQDSRQVEKVLSGMASSFETRTNELINDGMHILFNQAISGKLRAILQESFRDTSYMNREQQLLETDSTVQRRFSHQWHALIDPIMPYFTESNQMLLLGICCTNLSRLLERRVWDQRNKLDELGAIRLDRDISGIVSIATERAYNQRERFQRVAQLVMAINMDKEEEEASDIKWVITEAERRRAYQLRIDSDQCV